MYYDGRLVILLLTGFIGCQASDVETVGRNVTTPQASDSFSIQRSDWPLFRGDPLSSGVSRGRLPESLSLLWTFTVENGGFESTAAIVDGVVFIGDLDGRFFALRLSDGEKLWSCESEEQIGFGSSPAVCDHLVYIGDVDGVFYCFDATQGERQWSHATQAEINSSANFYGDNVLVGSQDATLYCLNAKSGELVWKHAIDDQVRCTPTVVEDKAFLVGCDAKLHIIDLDTGTMAHAVPLDSPSGTTPAVLGDSVFFGTHGGTFYSVNWRQGEVQWTFEDPEDAQSFRASAAVTEQVVAIGCRNRRIYGLEPATGNLRWTFAAKRSVDSSPVIVNDRIYVGSSDGRLYGLDAETGREVWQYEVGGGIVASPAVADERLVIANDDGRVFCFGSPHDADQSGKDPNL